MNAVQMSKQDMSMLTTPPFCPVADVGDASKTSPFDPAGPYRALFSGQELHLLINRRDGTYLIALRSTERQVTLAGQRADQLEKSLDRISLHFCDLSDPRAESRFVRLVEVVLGGFLDKAKIHSSSCQSGR